MIVCIFYLFDFSDVFYYKEGSSGVPFIKNSFAHAGR